MIGAVAGRRFIASVETIFEPERHGIDAQLCRDDIHLRFAGPDGLRDAQAAKRTAAQFVRVDQRRCDPKVGNLIRSNAVF